MGEWRGEGRLLLRLPISGNFIGGSVVSGEGSGNVRREKVRVGGRRGGGGEGGGGDYMSFIFFFFIFVGRFFRIISNR